VLKNDIATYSAFLLNNGWLAHCSRGFAESFIAHCHWRHVPAGTGIQHAGEPGATVTGIAHGNALLTTSLSSPDSPTIHVMQPGEWFGFVPLFIGGMRPNSIVARTDVVLATMSQPEIEALLAPRPEWWRDIGTLGIIHANIATGIAADMMIRESRRRCAASLLQVADCRHADRLGSELASTPLSQEELAAIANLSRTSISSILRDFEETGLIKLGYRSFTIMQPGKLRDLVDNV
jgi:CRP/FNR family transcriptional regulator, cyclic AMP receptor protein